MRKTISTTLATALLRLLGVVHGPSPRRRSEVHLRTSAVYDHSWRGVAGVRLV